MESVWKLMHSIIIPIVTYGAEGWDPTNTEHQYFMESEDSKDFK